MSSASAAGTQQIYPQGSPFPAGHSGKAFRCVWGGGPGWEGLGAQPCAACDAATSGSACRLQARGRAEALQSSGSARTLRGLPETGSAVSHTFSHLEGTHLPGGRQSGGFKPGLEPGTPGEAAGSALSPGSQSPQPDPGKRGRLGPSCLGSRPEGPLRGTGRVSGLLQAWFLAYRASRGHCPCQAGPGGREGLTRLHELNVWA